MKTLTIFDNEGFEHSIPVSYFGYDTGDTCFVCAFIKQDDIEDSFLEEWLENKKVPYHIQVEDDNIITIFKEKMIIKFADSSSIAFIPSKTLN